MAFRDFPQEFEDCLAIMRCEKLSRDFPIRDPQPARDSGSAVDLHEHSSVPSRPAYARFTDPSMNFMFVTSLLQHRTVSWLMSMPRSCRSATFGESGKRTYIITAKRKISELVR
jgi:hypothetical protein